MSVWKIKLVGLGLKKNITPGKHFAMFMETRAHCLLWHLISFLKDETALEAVYLRKIHSIGPGPFLLYISPHLRWNKSISNDLVSSLYFNTINFINWNFLPVVSFIWNWLIFLFFWISTISKPNSLVQRFNRTDQNKKNHKNLKLSSVHFLISPYMMSSSASFLYPFYTLCQHVWVCSFIPQVYSLPLTQLSHEDDAGFWFYSQVGQTLMACCSVKYSKVTVWELTSALLLSSW